jgi:deoxyribonuclease V
MIITEPHPWNVSVEEAKRLQTELRTRLRMSDHPRLDTIRKVAGVDNSYRRAASSTTAYAVVVVLSFPELDVVEEAYARLPVEFPYVPGLLAFREGPAVLAAFRRLTVEPDVVLFDGQGYAHPRRLGLASHLGVILDRPSIGCAKTRLTGHCAEPGPAVGDWTPLIDRDEVIGAALRTRPGHAPLFVSIGNQVSLPTAVRIVLACCREERFMPEPTRLAHALVTKFKTRDE